MSMIQPTSTPSSSTTINIVVLLKKIQPLSKRATNTVSKRKKGPSQIITSSPFKKWKENEILKKTEIEDEKQKKIQARLIKKESESKQQAKKIRIKKQTKIPNTKSLKLKKRPKRATVKKKLFQADSNFTNEERATSLSKDETEERESYPCI